MTDSLLTSDIKTLKHLLLYEKSWSWKKVLVLILMKMSRSWSWFDKKCCLHQWADVIDTTYSHSRRWFLCEWVRRRACCPSLCWTPPSLGVRPEFPWTWRSTPCRTRPRVRRQAARRSKSRSRSARPSGSPRGSAPESGVHSWRRPSSCRSYRVRRWNDSDDRLWISARAHNSTLSCGYMYRTKKSVRKFTFIIRTRSTSSK